MPKQVDHDARRRALADAACAVIAREGLDGASLPRVAAEAGWSVGSMRHYFADKQELLVFALEHAGGRIEQRIAAGGQGRTAALEALRAAVLELLPLDAPRRREALVWLAFVARAGVDPGLARAADRFWLAIDVPLRERLRDAVDRGELPPDFAVERRANALHALVDGLVLHLATTPGLVDADHVVAVLDGHLAELGSPPGDGATARTGTGPTVSRAAPGTTP